jgi:hypothetical protein
MFTDKVPLPPSSPVPVLLMHVHDGPNARDRGCETALAAQQACEVAIIVVCSAC